MEPGRNAIEDAYPLSMLQQGMLFHSIQNPRLSVYHDVVTLSIDVRWDAEVFDRALNHMVRKHQVLRTRFHLAGARPLQMVIRDRAPEVEVVDVRDRTLEAQKVVIRKWVEDEKARGIDPTRQPWRVTVHRLGEDRIQFGLSLHHALMDGWSVAAFVAELFATFARYQAGGRAHPDRRPPPSYKHFIALEQAAVESPAARRFWNERLAEARLPWWSGSPKSSSVRFGCEVTAARSERLMALAAALGVQEKSVWCALYLALLWVLDGSEEVVGSVVTHGRPELPGGERMLGLFLNSLPLRLAVGGRRWSELIRAVDRELTEQHAHRHFPLAEIQHQTGLDFAASMFNYMNFHVYEAGGGGSEVLGVGGFDETNYLLAVNVQKNEKAGRHLLLINAEPTVFGADFRARIGAYLEHILEALSGDAEARIERELLLGREELERQLGEFNATVGEQPGVPIHELIEAQALRSPDAIAVVHESGELSYRELNARANRVAHGLIARGVGPEVGVGVCLERTPEMVVALLGVLKAGGYYVPLDPGYPQARLDYLLADSGVERIVTSERVRARVELPADRCEEVARLVGGEASRSNPRRRVGGESLAYVIYTSGSTGRPKGVGIRHAGVVSLLSWAAAELETADLEGVLASTSICFDLSIYELFLPLSCGHSCVVVDTVLGLEGTRHRDRVSLLNTVPSAARALLERGALPRGLRVVNLAGEPLKAALVDELYGVLAGGRVYDLYGPSEGTTYSTYTQRRRGGVETIGRPVANTRAYVLDARGRVQALGVVGELYLGGAGLARGYLGRPGLTAERFVPDPFGSEPGSRLYRTGDLVRYLADGRLVFLGRLDHQVKVRGYRIELGEIETVLGTHRGVKEAVVVAREEGPERQRLVGYVVLEAGGELSAEGAGGALRAWLGERLPGYLVPGVLVVLEALPLTPNGKVDRGALPAPEGAISGAAYEAPEGVSEELLASLWSDLLKRERVGRNDHFFELGGHSLLATQLLSRIRDAFGVEIEIKALYERPLLHEMARHISRISALVNMDDSLLDELSEEEAEELLRELDGV